LNFGHTIGHALERVSGYAMPHGYAVAAGMVVEARIGALLGVSEEGTAVRLGQVLDRLGLPGPAVTDIDAVIAATRTDKKGRADRVRYALVAGPGRCARTDSGDWTFAVPPGIVRTALEVPYVALSQENTDV